LRVKLKHVFSLNVLPLGSTRLRQLYKYKLPLPPFIVSDGPSLPVWAPQDTIALIWLLWAYERREGPISLPLRPQSSTSRLPCLTSDANILTKYYSLDRYTKADLWRKLGATEDVS